MHQANLLVFPLEVFYFHVRNQLTCECCFSQVMADNLPADLVVAGKTGTTNEQRDSWFAGYSGDHLGVVWVGKDDNTPTRLTGSRGALLVWADIFKHLSTSSLAHNPPDNIEYHWIDENSGLRSGENCRNAQLMPFIVGSEPKSSGACEWIENPIKHWLKKWF